jgi:hypothetical protein
VVRRIWGGLEEIASARSFAILLALFVVFCAVLFPMHTSQYGRDAVTLDRREFGFGPREAAAALAKFTGAELVAYAGQELITDLAFPIVYSLLSAVALALLARRVRVPRALVLLPFATAIADYVENVSIALMIVRELAGRPLGLAAVIGSAGSRVKHLGLYFLVLSLAWLGIAALLRRRPASPAASSV